MPPILYIAHYDAFGSACLFGISSDIPVTLAQVPLQNLHKLPLHLPKILPALNFLIPPPPPPILFSLPFVIFPIVKSLLNMIPITPRALPNIRPPTRHSQSFPSLLSPSLFPPKLIIFVTNLSIIVIYLFWQPVEEGLSILVASLLGEITHTPSPSYDTVQGGSAPATLHV